MSRIRIAVQGIVEVEVESEELIFSDLKKEACQLPPPAVGVSRAADARLAGTKGGGLHLRM